MHPDSDLPNSSPVEPVEDSYVGRLIAGRYAIAKKLNQGGMGAVYLAIQRPLDRPVALKVLLKSQLEDPMASRRFEKEARSVSKLTHPHVVTLYDFGSTDGGELYIAMEYLEGTSLRELLQKQGVLAWDRALHIVRGVTSGLVAAHAAGIIHRDLKPENVMLVERSGDADFAKVLDFGLAKSMEPDFSGPITQRDIIPGTPAYLAPERANGIADDPRSDLYSLGAMWFELLVGRPPFLAESSIKVILQHVHEQPPIPSVANPHNPIPESVDETVLALLEKQPDRRPRSAAALLERLDALYRPRGWHVGTGDSLGRRGHEDVEVSRFAEAVSELTELRFSLEGVEEVVPLVRRKHGQVVSKPQTTIAIEAFAMPAPVGSPALGAVPDEPVLLTKKKKTPAPPAQTQTPPPTNLRISSVDDVAGYLAHAKTAREVAELSVAFLATRFDRCAVADLRSRHVLASLGVADASGFCGAVAGSSGMQEMLARSDAYYGPSVAAPDWLPFFRSLGGALPGALFIATLKREGQPAFLFYGDHKDNALRPDVKDAVTLLREAATAFSVVNL